MTNIQQPYPTFLRVSVRAYNSCHVSVCCSLTALLPSYEHRYSRYGPFEFTSIFLCCCFIKPYDFFEWKLDVSNKNDTIWLYIYSKFMVIRNSLYFQFNTWIMIFPVLRSVHVDLIIQLFAQREQWTTAKERRCNLKLITVTDIVQYIIEYHSVIDWYSIIYSSL
jgi:hypothetical protein